MRGYLVIKRGLDIVAGLMGLILLSPLFAWISWKIKRSDGGPVFFLGERVGLNGKPFRIYKFRTMVKNAGTQGPAITSSADQRITPFGRELRKRKLDELPQLINVLKGEMSLVGPRPEAPCYVKLYTPEQRVVLKMRPGITGMASLQYHEEAELLETKMHQGNLSLEEVYLGYIMPAKLALELEYYRKRSLLSDLKLIFQTLRALCA